MPNAQVNVRFAINVSKSKLSMFIYLVLVPTVYMLVRTRRVSAKSRI